MGLDRSYVELNRAATNRLRALADRLSDEQLRHPVGQHWTVAIVFAHLAFWDRRVMLVLDLTEQKGKITTPEIDIAVNDISLPLWAAIPARQATKLSIETAQAMDARLENFAPELVEQVYSFNKRWVVRALHRNEHLDEAEAALKG